MASHLDILVEGVTVGADLSRGAGTPTSVEVALPVPQSACSSTASSEFPLCNWTWLPLACVTQNKHIPQTIYGVAIKVIRERNDL